MQDTSKYRYLFFSSPDVIPEYVVHMIENGTVRRNIQVTNYYVVLDGLKIGLSTPNFVPPIPSLIHILGIQNPSMNREDVVGLAWSIRIDVKRRISLPVSDPDHLAIQEEQSYISRIEWQPRITKEYGSENGVWLSFLIDVERNAVVGTYSGFVEVDGRGYRYSRGSFIELHPDYRGRGLCRDFARYSYSEAAVLYDISYFKIKVGAIEQVGACRCYTQAAMDIGFSVYLDSSLVQDKSACDIFRTNPNASMLLVKEGLSLDTLLD